MTKTRRSLLNKALSRIVAGLWSVVILVVALPLAIALWMAWMVISIPGSIIFDTTLFRWSGGAPGFAFASETFTWFQSNANHALFGSGSSVQWTADYQVDRWERGV
ncbi:hypothetical protein C471_09415 [Halorubrum saccharovorum DSM 1137]|uniref:Uncharacterized protein n=1 Tax=Halorubrum saccharovorum DSM 1137 TaxID=1227484 RepID=M0DVC2_9EURY|nr:hypothetical protein C471_09415 [Halorubrum saccharovorum DSM 1137]